MHKKENIAIEVSEVSKSFKIPHEKQTSLKGTIFNLFKRKTFTELKSADNISFEVYKGEFLGLIGRNGCGKSTLLKMIAKIYEPDSGRIKINGDISPFLELGVGFNPELTARENIYLNGAMLGLSKKEIDEKFDKIIDFSELRDFLDQKLKNFSSGMQVRLAFSVAIHSHSDILLIDEVLAVGDSNFQKKCLEKFREFREQKKTVIFVSHSMPYVKDFCDRVLVLEGGEIVFNGDAVKAIDYYNKINLKIDIIENNQFNHTKKNESTARFRRRNNKKIQNIK